MLSLTQLSAYVAVVETGTFQAAAERLGVSQPTVSQSLRSLEAHFGVALISRNRVRCEPTAAGNRLLRHARAITRLAAVAEESMLRPRVSIGASGNVGTYLLPPFLRRFLDAGHGTNSFDVTIASNPELARSLESGEVDVAVMEWWDGRPGFSARTWRREELVVITAPDHPWAGRSAVTRKQLLATPMIGGEAGTGTGRLLRRLFGASEKELQVSYTMASTEGVKSAVRAGLGISVVFAAAVADEVAAGTLHALRVSDVPITKDLQIVMPADSPATSPATRFADLLTTQAA
ncbi:LysR family transcriptional regulator [uncultured Piscinibacter sp.]|uniref:LysR family transcriptional regulator n=1 Tax=uncultured Piscinibacter sp. TaxID=1131835 RepID=UPI0026315A06|nr:LysR family transcriptional regulator [uncultured Piscinibacter sp.]